MLTNTIEKENTIGSEQWSDGLITNGEKEADVLIGSKMDGGGGSRLDQGRGETLEKKNEVKNQVQIELIRGTTFSNPKSSHLIESSETLLSDQSCHTLTESSIFGSFTKSRPAHFPTRDLESFLGHIKWVEERF